MKYIKNYINGELIPPVLDEHIENIDPSRGKVYSMIPDSDEKDVEKAVDAAEKALEYFTDPEHFLEAKTISNSSQNKNVKAYRPPQFYEQQKIGKTFQ